MEPWLRGTTPHTDPIVRAVLHSFEQVREDLEHWTAKIDPADAWRRIDPLSPLGFQLRHIAGSVDRLTTYAAGGQLRPEQLDDLRREREPGATIAELMAEVHASLDRSAAILSTISDFHAAREVGRQRLPTTAGGLLVHIAEHTQRHLGQAILTCKLLLR